VQYDIIKHFNIVLQHEELPALSTEKMKTENKQETNMLENPT